MASVLERITKLEEARKTMRTDLDETILVQKRHEKALHSLATDKARLITGAWVVNFLGPVFIGVIMYLGNRAAAAELQQFKAAIVQEIQVSKGKH